MIKPLGKRCLIEIEKQKETKGGIIIASNQSIIIETAEIKEVGEDVRKVKKGNKVMFKSWSIDSVKIGEYTYDFISEDDIISIVK